MSRDYHWYAGVNRYVCDTLKEMRDAVKQLWNPIARRHLMSLIEEAQSCVNRMEAGLADWSDLRDGKDVIRKMKKDYKQLKKDIEELQKQKEQLEAKVNGHTLTLKKSDSVDVTID